MKTVTFISGSESKMDLLVKLAHEIGIKTYVPSELSDEDMALPGSKASKKQLEEWLAKDDGESYSVAETKRFIKKNIAVRK